MRPTNITRNIGGWLTEAEGHYLYETAKKVKKGNAIVEIGSWKGKSTICLGLGSRDGRGVKIVAIDPHTGNSEHGRRFGKVNTFAEFKRNIHKAGVSPYIESILDTSENASHTFYGRVGFIFIDGAHELKSVWSDWKLWFPKVIDNGIVAFHDTWHYPGPNFATAIILLTSHHVRHPRLVDTITCFEKVEKNFFLDRIQNTCFVLYRTLVGFWGAVKLSYSSRA